MNLIDGDKHAWKTAFTQHEREGGVPGLFAFFIKKYPQHVENPGSWSDNAHDLPREEKERFLAQFYIERGE